MWARFILVVLMGLGVLALALTQRKEPSPEQLAKSKDRVLPPASESFVLFVGHSLVVFQNDLKKLASESKLGFQEVSLLNRGASLKTNWERKDPEFFSRLKDPVSALVLTERVLPLSRTLDHDDPVGYAVKFIEAIMESHPNAQPYLYETWHRRQGESWRTQLSEDRKLWLTILSGVNERSQTPMLLIPAGAAMGALEDSGEFAMERLFSDDIHLSDLGRYFVALVHYGSLYRQSPVGLRAPEELTEKERELLQKTAWQAVVENPYGGI